MGDPSNIGMMEGAFFVSRSELINWVNRTLQLHVSKVEECCTGAIYAQVVDAVHPGKVQMGKIKWNARTEPDYIHNFKVLQQALNALSVTRTVDVQKLVRGKYQDNLEMLQWIHAYHERMGSGADYDPVRRRGNITGQNIPAWLRPEGADKPERTRMKENVHPDRGVAAPKEKSEKARTSVSQLTRGTGSQVTKEDLLRENARLREELEHMRGTAQGLERERDFYFGKLRDIEIQCQTHESGTSSDLTLDVFMGDVQRVLYATDDDEEAEPAAA
jgi:RP/EB family microtubule-associated protein